MTKGRGPRFEAKKPIMRTRQKKSKGEGATGGGATSESSETKCWTFALSEMTSAGRAAETGTRVNGPLRGGRVVVMAQEGTLGFAPLLEGNEMISAVENSGRSLSGNVVTNGRAGPKVKLCLN